MANKLKYINDIEQGKIIQSWHVSQSVEAFSSTDQQAYDISVSGSFKVTGSQFIEPNNLLLIAQQYVLAYDNSTGQIFKMLASEGSSGGVYRTGSNINNIIPLNFGGNEATGSRSSILAGCSNVINTIGVNGVIGGGQFNLINASDTFIGGGSLNTGSGQNSAIVSGCKNQIMSSYGGKHSTIASGRQNFIDSSYQSFIGGGFLNELGAVSIPSSNQFIGTGNRNKICVLQGSNNSILGGSINEINGGYFGYGVSMYNNSIIGGCNNCITFYQNECSSVVTPHSNFIGAGNKNVIGSNRLCVIIGNHSGIVAGTLNTASGCNSFIGAGSNNNIRNWLGSNSTSNTACSNASIVGGLNNYIVASPNTFIGGGKENSITTTVGNYSNQSTIIAGTGSRINCSCNSFIGSGCKNTINGPNSRNNVIAGGEGNCIDGQSIMSTIVGGTNNYLYGGCGIFIGGGNCNSVAGNNKNTVIVGGMCNVNPYGNAYTFIGAGCKNNLYASYRSGIVAGATNTINGGGTAFIGAGTNNYIYSSTTDSAIVGGRCNKISGYSSYGHFIGGGCNNFISSNYPNRDFCSNSIVSGVENRINHGKCSSILGGEKNFITSSLSTSIIGGISNTASITTGSFIGSGEDNINEGNCSFIGSGECNIICSFLNQRAGNAVIVGGRQNTASNNAERGFIGSGCENAVCGFSTSVVGGSNNIVSNNLSSIVGGNTNRIASQFSFIGGGQSNTTGIGNDPLTIVGGSTNCMFGSPGFSFIGAGQCNKICSNSSGLPSYKACFSSIVGGEKNVIGNGNFNALHSIIGGGQLNTASANFSGILGGECNVVQHCKSFIIGANLTSDKACYTFMNNLDIEGTVSASIFSGSFVGDASGLTNVPGGGGATNPAGSNTQIQFNNAGNFGASSDFIFDSTGPTAKITGSLIVSQSVATETAVTVENGHVILSQVSQSLDFVDDTAAATGGVPKGGLYRSGNFIAIRID